MKWADGLYLYENQTNYQNEKVIAWVPDCTLADANYVNNPATREWEYCGDSCVSCSSKYGCEKCDGLDDNHSVSLATFNVTGYETDFSVWYRWNSIQSYCETCTLNSTNDGITWLSWGYGIDNSLWGSCSQTSTWSAFCNSEWKAWYEEYFLEYSEIGTYVCEVCDYGNWGDWDQNTCTKCMDGYSFDNANDWSIECASQSYYFGDWKTWSVSTVLNQFRSCEICHKDLIMDPISYSLDGSQISNSCSATCNDGEYVEYNLVSTSTELYHYREWEECPISSCYQWSGIDSDMWESCMSGYYLKTQGSSSE